MNDQPIGFDIFDSGIAEQHKRGTPELDHNFGRTLSQALTGAEVKGNSSPTPIVDEQFQGNEGFGIGVRGHIGLMPIANDTLAIDNAFAVLPADHVLQDILWTQELNSVKNFSLLIADFVGIERNRWLHRGHGEKLEEVIRHHVAKRASSLIKSAAMLNTDSFRGSNLHVIDVIAIPERFDDVVRETKHHYVLNRFFSEIVVDAVDLVFVESLLKVRV